MQQVWDLVHGEVISGTENLGNRVYNTIIGAMEASHMVRYLHHSTLVITPGDRSDNILAALSTNLLGGGPEPLVAGLVLTGGFRPDGTVMRLVRDSQLPVLLVGEDTYSVTNKFRETPFKIAPGDRMKLETAACLVGEYVDVDGILKGLKE